MSLHKFAIVHVIVRVDFLVVLFRGLGVVGGTGCSSVGDSALAEVDRIEKIGDSGLLSQREVEMREQLARSDSSVVGHPIEAYKLYNQQKHLRF